MLRRWLTYQTAEVSIEALVGTYAVEISTDGTILNKVVFELVDFPRNVLAWVAKRIVELPRTGCISTTSFLVEDAMTLLFASLL